MNRRQFPPSSLNFISIVFCIFVAIPPSNSDDYNEQYSACIHSHECGSALRNIRYPFWGGNRPQYCGRKQFELKCHENQTTTMVFGPQTFRVLDIKYSHQTMTLARDDPRGNICPTTFDQTIFSYDLPNTRNLSLFYNCSDGVSDGPNKYDCHISDSTEQMTGFYMVDDDEDGKFPNLSNTCKGVINLPVASTALNNFGPHLWLTWPLVQWFEVMYNEENERCSRCSNSSGICGSDSSNNFLCLCRDESRPNTCPGHPVHKRDYVLKVIIGLCATALGMFIMGTVAFVYIRRNKKKNAPSSYVSRSTYSGSSSGLDIEKGDDFHGLQVFTYNELEVATHYFDSAKELGDGGFGTVYHGKLRDGRAVAVKRLYENNCRRFEQFRNEIEILARLRHQNLVSLYGCTSRHSRELLLVYEYIPNGTVADHLHGERAKPGALPWHIRLKIAIETANALKYLHASDIIHRDVKTDNILLDKHFCVKVADFGLSRLFPTNVTHVSTAPQGTPGYVDPEYHQCYQLTDKSDVFSFGVVMIELISSMPAVDITRHRHEINLSNMAINKIQNKALHELVDPSLGYDSDYKVRKMVNAVAELAFQCLQSEKDMRPSMADALETLKAIQNDGNNKEKAEVMDIPADDVGLLKSGSLSMSPDTVTFSWTSTKTTTPNASS